MLLLGAMTWAFVMLYSLFMLWMDMRFLGETDVDYFTSLANSPANMVFSPRGVALLVYSCLIIPPFCLWGLSTLVEHHVQAITDDWKKLRPEFTQSFKNLIN